MRREKRVAFWLAIAAAAPFARAQGEATSTLAPAYVIHQAPLPGFDIPRALYPGNVQQADDAARQAAGAPTLPEFLLRRLQGVSVNDIQGSPYQVDLNYRGQRLSSLLGAPQGLSLYLDGVRMNQPFGDVVNWDLLPEQALAGLTLVPGANPLYGLNTLAGALVLTTASGLRQPGGVADLSVGSNGRKRFDVGAGHRGSDGWHAYVAGTAFEEQGWRDRSPGRLGNIFAKVGHQHDDSEWNVSLLHAASALTGNGLLNESLAATDTSAVYTAPDRTRSHDTLLHLQGTRAFDPDRTLNAHAWLRDSGRAGSNGDIADDAGVAAHLNRSNSSQQEAGAGVQFSRRFGDHQVVLGAEAAGSRLQHDQFATDAVFDAARNVLPLAGASTDHQVALRAHTARVSVFASDFIALSPRWRLSPGLRWNMVRLRNALGHPAPMQDERFRYGSLNPALGVTWVATDAVTAFASASQGNRVPSVLELGCADEGQPCVLPTGLQSDPFLRQVVSRTFEAGVRGRMGERVQWSAALFRTINRDDIAFVRSGVSQAGYFTNIGRTQRQGVELSAQARQGAWDWVVSYSALAATYQSSGVLPGPLSTAAQPNTFRPGTPIAGLPRHALKLALDWRSAPQWRLGVDLIAYGRQTVAGNESGSRPELGRLAGNALLHARASWQFAARWQAYLRVNNVLDRRYASAAAGNLDLFPRGQALQPGAEPQPARFIGPGAPRSATLGVRYAWND